MQLGSQDAAEDSTVIVNSPGALGFASGIVTFNIGGLSGNGNIDLEDSASNPVTIQVGGDNADTIYSGVFSGDGSLTKTGSGILILSPPSGGNTYTGGTTVSEGTLEAKCTAALPGTGQVSVAPLRHARGCRRRGGRLELRRERRYCPRCYDRRRLTPIPIWASTPPTATSRTPARSPTPAQPPWAWSCWARIRSRSIRRWPRTATPATR